MFDPISSLMARKALVGAAVAAPPVIHPAPVQQETVPPPLPPVNRLDERMALVQGPEGSYAQYAEIMRVVDLPVLFPMDTREIEEYSRMHVLADAYYNGFRLWWSQCESLFAYQQIKGLFAPIGVGWGKTLSTLMIANAAYAKGIGSILLLVPSQVFIQLTSADIKWARSRVPMNLPIHILGGRNIGERKSLANSKRRGLYIMPYSLLSAKDAEENLWQIKPGLVIADECQNLRHKSAARSGRLFRYLDSKQLGFTPEFVCLSGTITSKTVNDYHHLIRAALGANSPLPHSVTLAAAWGAVIDAEAPTIEEAGGSGGTGALTPLIDWAKRIFPAETIQETTAGFRYAYRLRLNHTLGVVTSGDQEIGTSLVYSNRKVEQPESFKGWEELQRLMKKVTDEWLTPNDDEIEHAIHTWKWLYELTSGFYNQLTWPTIDTYARRRGMSEQQAYEILLKSKDHHETGQYYMKLLRRWLQEEAKKGIDTAFLVGADMKRHGAQNVSQELYEAWSHWKSMDFEGRPERDSTAIRVCDYKIFAAVRWAGELPKDAGALIWVYHQEMGQWVYDELIRAGVDALHCPAGDGANAAILDPVNARKKIVCSIKAHGTGKNLQHFSEQFFVQWPRPAADAEQTVGRTHRSGQQAESLTVWTCNTTEFDDLNFAASLNDALYIHQTTGSRQKLIYGVYDPLPKIFPTTVLYERGLKNFLLTQEQQRLMTEKFAPEAA